MIRQKKFEKDYRKLRQAHAQRSTDDLVATQEEFTRPFMGQFVALLGIGKRRSRSLWFYQITIRVVKDELASRFNREFIHDQIGYDS